MAAQDQSGTPPGIEFYGGYQVYSESGVDLTLLRQNLTRSLEERWENNRRAVAFARALRDAVLNKAGPASKNQEEPVTTDAVGIVRALVAHHVEFIVVGGHAMLTHGSAYVIEDLELCYRRTPANSASLAAACAPLHPCLRGAPAGLPFRFDPPTIQAGLNFTLTTDLGDIDFLGEVSGIGGYDQTPPLSEEHTLFGMTVRILSLEGLILAKKAPGRGNNLHLLELEELKKLRDAKA